MVSRILCFTMFFGLAFGATFLSRTPVKPQRLNNIEGCYIEEINEVIAYGETITPPGQCYRVECLGSRIGYASCGVVSTDDPNCYVTEADTRKQYPDCCPNIRCEIDNNL